MRKPKYFWKRNYKSVRSVSHYRIERWITDHGWYVMPMVPGKGPYYALTDSQGIQIPSFFEEMWLDAFLWDMKDLSVPRGTSEVSR
jgi:hypothetical protein